MSKMEAGSSSRPSRPRKCFSINKPTVLRYVALVVGCIAKLLSGSIYTFGVYNQSLKKTFGLSQSNVELIASIQTLGIEMVVVPGILVDSFGSIPVSITGIALTTLGYGLVFSSFYSTTFYGDNYGLLALYFNIGAFGASFMYINALVTNVHNFPQRHRAKVICVMDMMYQGSLFVFSAIYQKWFAHGHYIHEEKQNLRGYIILCIILYIIVGLLCVAFLHKIDVPPEVSTDEVSLIDGNKIEPNGDNEPLKDGSNEEVVDYGTNSVDETPSTPVRHPAYFSYDNTSVFRGFWNILKYPSFHLLAWSFALVCGGFGLHVNNFGPTYKSIGLGKYLTIVTMSYTIPGLLGRAIFAPLSDLVYPSVPRIFFISGGYLFAFIGYIFFICLNVLSNYSLMIFINVMIGLGVSLTYTFIPTLLADIFSSSHLGLHFGLFRLLTFFLVLTLQYIYGIIYDTNVENFHQLTVPGNITSLNVDCYGVQCTQMAYIIVCCLAAISICFSVGAHVLIKNKK